LDTPIKWLKITVDRIKTVDKIKMKPITDQLNLFPAGKRDKSFIIFFQQNNKYENFIFSN
jgi:hypothetical protein